MSAFLKLEDLVEMLQIDTRENLEPEFDACIYRVSKELRSINEKAYTPQLVSMGPLHHGKEELANMEKKKRKYVKSFFERITVANQDKILNFIKDNEENVRNCYTEISKLSSIEYVVMILYDAIFIIELLLKEASNFGRSDLLLSTSTIRASLCRDFQLLENQLPYFVLEEICKLALIPTFMELSLFWFNSFQGLQLCRLTPEVGVKHLTDWRRTTILEHYQRFEQSKGWIHDLPCAMKLHELGVKFKCFQGEHSLIDIEFKKVKNRITRFEEYEMLIPHLEIYDDTESFFRNVMAWEQCHYPLDTLVCNYVRLMDCLINTKKDVDLLVRNGIISNSMGNNASVAKMFNRLGQFVSLSKSSYYDVCEELKEYCNNPWSKRIATYNRAKKNLKTVYFNNLLRGTATVGTVLLLLLTIIQAICSILQVVSM